MGRVLIAGCGYVGVATADLFQAAGWEVEGWTHSGESAAQLADKPYAVRAVDIAEPSAMEAAAGRFDAVIHCASSGGGGAESYRRVYLEGARNLLAALRPSHVHLHEQHVGLRADRRGMGRRRERGGTGSRDRKDPARGRRIR